MKLSIAVFLLLAPGANCRTFQPSFLSRAQTSSSALRADSEALDHVMQLAASALAPGPTRDFLKTLRLCAPCNHFERFGEYFDGGYVMCTDGLDKGLVSAYSYGINGFDGWGMAVASRFHIPLNEYDCTNFKRPVACNGCDVSFHAECILEAQGRPQAMYKTLSQQLRDSGNGKAKNGSLLLKIDVEAAEWKVFAQEPVENLRKFREIVVEYHWISQVEKHPLYLQAVQKVEQAGFAVAHLHGNNYGGGLSSFGKFRIPNVLEVTYIQKPKQGCAAGIPYRLHLDMPNNANAGELGDAVLPTKM